MPASLFADTIAAVATPQGRGAVALVRVSGDNGRSFTEAFRPGTENAARSPIGTASAGSGTSAAQQVDTGLGGLY